MKKPYFNRKKVSESQIRWILGRIHISTSARGIIREFYRRTAKGIDAKAWTKTLRKQVYRLALWQWAKDRALYRYVTGGIK